MTSHYPCNATLKNEQNVILFDCSFCTQTCLSSLSTHKEIFSRLKPFRNWCPKSHSGSKSSKLSHHLFFGVKIQILHGIHELGSQQFEISKVRPFLAHCVFGHVSVLFRFPCMEIRDKDWNFYVGLEIVEGSGDFFFQPPFDLHFPPMLPLLNSWALGMKKWSKNRACQFRSVRPLKISKPRSVTNLKTKKNSMLLRG